MSSFVPGSADFFEQQDRATRNTKRLVLLLVLGVLGIIASVHVVIAAVMTWTGGYVPDPSLGVGRTFQDTLFDLETLLLVALGVGVVVSGGSFYKVKALGGGGAEVARSLGGRRLDPGTTDPNERRLLNVVEEMAIASGLPVPPVYVMDGEPGINAFAAGYEPTHAVIGVTRGAIEQLDRAELQGVIAHEFSHVLNGDMRLNIQLIGILHGVLLIGIIGRVLMHSGGGRRGGGRGGGNQVALVGLALFAVGYLGTLCGSIIKAAVSRQREYLADSAAVQFTRNPAGIAGALARIGGLAQGSKMEHPRASELSHMYFGRGGRSAFGGVFATHPPLRKRIERIDPSFLELSADRIAERAAETAAALDTEPSGAALGFAAGSGRSAGAGAAETQAGGGPPRTRAGAHGGAPEPDGFGDGHGEPPADTPDAAGEPGAPGVVSLDEALRQLGRPTPAHVAYVQGLLAGIPEPLKAAAHDRTDARLMVASLLLSPDREVRGDQLRILEEQVGPDAPGGAERLAAAARTLDPHARLPLIEMAIGTLAEMPGDEHRSLHRTLHALAAADGSLEPFEWVAVSLVLRHTDPSFTVRKRKGRYTRLQGVSESVTCLLSALAHAGHPEHADALAAFRTGLDSVPEIGRRELASSDDCGPSALDGALDELSHLEARLKRQVLEACARTIAADGRVTLAEGEIFRVIADWLDCPAPPLLPGQRVRTSGA